MKITDYSPVSKTSTTGKKKTVSATGAPDGEFLGLLSANETESMVALSPAQDIQPVSSMDALLSLQEMPDDEIKKRLVIQDN